MTSPGIRMGGPAQMRYRRALIAGGTYFFAVNLADRSGGAHRAPPRDHRPGRMPQHILAI